MNHYWLNPEETHAYVLNVDGTIFHRLMTSHAHLPEDALLRPIKKLLHAAEYKSVQMNVVALNGELKNRLRRTSFSQVMGLYAWISLNTELRKCFILLKTLFSFMAQETGRGIFIER